MPYLHLSVGMSWAISISTATPLALSLAPTNVPSGFSGSSIGKGNVS